MTRIVGAGHGLLLFSCSCRCCSRAAFTAERVTPYSVVYYCLTDDEAQTRRQLLTVRDLGATKTLALIYWWQAETLGGDYWQKDYRPNQVGEGWYKAVDNYVRISLEMGLKPCFRLGSFREWNGLWHPADASGSVEKYADWVRTLCSEIRRED